MSAAKNNKQNRDGIDNAEEVIQRFGGIRPMASKMDVPVTTVQGWKKRNVIPGNRIDEVLKAAQHNDVDLSGIAIKGVANENGESSARAGDKDQAATAGSFKDEVKQASEEQDKGAINKHEKAVETALLREDGADEVQDSEKVSDVAGKTADDSADPKKTVSARHDVLMKEIKMAERMAVKKAFGSLRHWLRWRWPVRPYFLCRDNRKLPSLTAKRSRSAPMSRRSKAVMRPCSKD